MGFLKKIGQSLFGSGGGGTGEDRGIYLCVKCHKCGAAVRIRADPQHDLQRDYDGGGFVLRKEIMDSKCYTLMYATVHFDAAYRITDQEIQGGAFITEEAYQAWAGEKPPVPGDEA